MALNFPNPALQTPVNTYSPTSTPAATTNGVTYTWDGVLGAWLASVGGGTTNTFGLGLNLTGSLVKVSIPAASLPPTAGAGATQAIVGSLYWDDNLTQLFIRYNNGGNPVWVAAAPQASGGGGGVTAVTATAPLAATAGSAPVISATLATAAQAAAGTSAAVLMTPQFAVPKDAAGMAGAAILPGSNAAYVGSPTVGMIRYNNSTPPAVIEYYNGSAWVALGGGGGGTAATLAEAAAGTINTKYSSPETAVPKNAAGMTGAGLMPGGTDAQRPLTPVKGMFRFNDQGGGDAFVEYYDGSNWVTLISGGPDNADPYGWFGHGSKP
jgi:hypothetical protein